MPALSLVVVATVLTAAFGDATDLGAPAVASSHVSPAGSAPSKVATKTHGWPAVARLTT